MNMKRQILSLATALALTASGALFAQSGDPYDASAQQTGTATAAGQNEPATGNDRVDQPQDPSNLGTPAAGSDQDSLPQTGSDRPLVGLIGFLTLFAGIVVRALRW